MKDFEHKERIVELLSDKMGFKIFDESTNHLFIEITEDLTEAKVNDIVEYDAFDIDPRLEYVVDTNTQTGLIEVDFYEGEENDGTLDRYEYNN